jgi:hypothetical protein
MCPSARPRRSGGASHSSHETHAAIIAPSPAPTISRVATSQAIPPPSNASAAPADISSAPATVTARPARVGEPPAERPREHAGDRRCPDREPDGDGARAERPGDVAGQRRQDDAERDVAQGREGEDGHVGHRDTVARGRFGERLTVGALLRKRTG